MMYTMDQIEFKKYIIDNNISNFKPNEKNFIPSLDQLIVKLQKNEYLIVNGQFRLTILKGKIKLNNCYILSQNLKLSPIFAPGFQSFPIITSYDPIEKNEIITNFQHDDDDEYLSVIKFESCYSGLEKIIHYHPPFKSLLNNKSYIENNAYDTNKYEHLFENYSFKIIFNEQNLNVLFIVNCWNKCISNFVKVLSNKERSKIIMIIGNKNSGKSTFSKTLLNSFILEKNKGICYFDLDPGQSEFSMPYCLSLHLILSCVFGLNIPISSIENNDEPESVIQYFGFNSPHKNIDSYFTIIKYLFEYYQLNYQKNGYNLIINTPGWIKGLGNEILMELTKIINPDMLIFLSKHLDLNHTKNISVFKNLTYQSLNILKGIFQNSKYSSSQIRDFNKLVYFHQIKVNKPYLCFNFEKHILEQSPLKLSYQTVKSPFNFIGISAITILNYDLEVDFDYDDILLMIDSTISSFYVIDSDNFHIIKSFFNKKIEFDNLPIYLNSSDFYKFFLKQKISIFKFMGLCLIHSFNKLENYFNIYLPQYNQILIKNYLLHGHKLILVKGDGNLPSSEIICSQKFFKNEFCAKKNKNLTIPFLDFEKDEKLCGVWKSRRNLLRKSQII